MRSDEHDDMDYPILWTDMYGNIHIIEEKEDDHIETYPVNMPVSLKGSV